MCLQTKSSHLSKRAGLYSNVKLIYCTVFKKNIILICLLLFSTMIGSGELCSSSLVLFGIQIYLYYLSDAPVDMS